MSKYKRDKLSRAAGIGELPEQWEVKRFRYCFANGKGLSITKENLIEIGVPCINYGEIHSKFGFKIDPDKHELLCVDEKYLETNQSSILSNGDFVFADTSEDIEGAGNFSHLIGERKIFAGYHTIISRLRINAIPKFIAYYLDSLAYRSQIRREVQGVKVFSITNKILKDTIVILPPHSVQLTIADYLDEETQKIDQLIANKKAQAEKLKELRQIEINNAVTKGLNPNAEMKDSGIDWMGKIPKDWKVKRIKDVASVRGRIGFRGYTVDDIVDDGALVIGAKHLNSSNQLNFKDPEYISWDKYYESPEIMVQLGDVLIVQRGSVGKFALVENEIGPATINPSMILLRLNKRIDPKFLFWFSLGEYFFNVIKTIVSSTAVPMISQMQAGVFRVLLPPMEEQIKIGNYLQQRTTSIDKLLKNTEAQIEKLHEMRKVKIYEAVTGKIKVNAYAEATA